MEVLKACSCEMLFYYPVGSSKRSFYPNPVGGEVDRLDRDSYVMEDVDGVTKELAFLSDVTLISSEGHKFPLHKAILADHSGFFKKAFHDLTVSNSFAMEETAELLQQALPHIYDSYESQPITEGNVDSLLGFFSKYDVRAGMSACDSFLSSSIMLSTVNLPVWMKVADYHKLPNFLELCIDYAAKNISTLITKIENHGTESWMEELTPTSLTRLLTQSTHARAYVADRKVRHILEIFKCVLVF